MKMSAIMTPTGLHLDFFDIAVDAYKKNETDTYRKIMTTLIASYKKLLQEIEIENAHLEQNQTLSINEEELETFYDHLYDAVDRIKLLKKHLEAFKESEGLFGDLFQTAEKLHETLMHHIDIVSTQEVKQLQKRYAKAS
jgi:hypothetical protein